MKNKIQIFKYIFYYVPETGETAIKSYVPWG